MTFDQNINVWEKLHQEMFEKSKHFAILFHSQNIKNQFQFSNMHKTNFVRDFDDFVDF